VLCWIGLVDFIHNALTLRSAEVDYFNFVVHNLDLLIELHWRQKSQLLDRIEKLIRENKRCKTKEEVETQKKIKAIGRCPMDFEWLKVENGWRCAGGSHTLTDAEIM
jgi:hypothetical protein